MMNIIRAEVYRLVRGKALYITFVLLAAFSAINILTFDGNISIGVNTSVIDTSMGGVDVLNGANAATFLMVSVDILLYFALPLIIAVAVAMFTCGAVKNDISTGMSRVKMYLSKLIISCAVSLLLMVVYFAVEIIIATVANGLGDWSGSFLPTFLAGLGGQAWMLVALTCVGVFFSFLTKGSGATTGAYLALLYVPMLVIMILSSVYPSLAEIQKYDFIFTMRMFAYIGDMSQEDILRGLAIGAVLIIASTAGGITLFKRAEIK